MSKYIC